MSLNLNICRNLFFLYIHLPKLTPSNCFLLSWCPLMLGWEDPPGAGKHPHQLGWVEEQREKSQYPDVEEWAPLAMAGRCWGQYPFRVPGCSLHSCSEASIPLQYHHLCPKSSGGAALAGCYVNCALFACRKPSAGWYGNPPQNTQGCSMGNRFFGEGTGVPVEVGGLMPKGRKDPCNHAFIWKSVL